MSDTSVTLNAGSGGAALATYTDTGSQVHQKVILETQTSTADPAKVNSSNPLPVTLANTGANATAIAVSAASLPLPTGAATSLADNSTFTRGTTPETAVAAVVESSAPSLTAGHAGALSMDTSGNLRVTVSNGIQAGTAGSPDAQVLSIQGIASMTAVKVDGSGVTQPVSGTLTANAGTGNFNTVPALATSGGASYNNAIAPATPAVTTVKAGAGNLYGIVAFNLNATPVYIKFFDAAAPTLGTTAASFQFMVPGNTGGAGFVIPLHVPRSLVNAIKYAVTNAIGATDNTAITANSVIVDVAYN